MSGNRARETKRANEKIRREQRHEDDHRRLPPDILGPRTTSAFGAALDIDGRRKDAVDHESLDRSDKEEN